MQSIQLQRRKSRIPFRTRLEASLNRCDGCFFVLLTEGTDHSWGSPTETRPPLSPPQPPSGGLPSSSLHLPLTPERQTSDWPSYISDQIPLGGAGLCGSNRSPGESAPSAMFPPLPLTVSLGPHPGLWKGLSLALRVLSPSPNLQRDWNLGSGFNQLSSQVRGLGRRWQQVPNGGSGTPCLTSIARNPPFCVSSSPPSPSAPLEMAFPPGILSR